MCRPRKNGEAGQRDDREAARDSAVGGRQGVPQAREGERFLIDRPRINRCRRISAARSAPDRCSGAWQVTAYSPTNPGCRPRASIGRSAALTTVVRAGSTSIRRIFEWD